MSGSFAAEHGLGRSKVELADALRPASGRSMMRAIKGAIDPGGLLNPGVIVS
jgi:FAD/FMN-containing dehydrogenase